MDIDVYRGCNEYNDAVDVKHDGVDDLTGVDVHNYVVMI